MMRDLILPLSMAFSMLLFSSCQPVAPAGRNVPETMKDPVTSPVVNLPEDRKQLLMHYMPWYKTPEIRGSWGSHWTGPENQHHPDEMAEDGFPDIWSHYDPLIGPYDSSDPDVLECHLLQMKLAGVDGVIVDWYGIGQVADYPMIHEGTESLFDVAGQLGMSFSVCYEDRTVKLKVERDHLAAEDVEGHLTETLAWMQENWFQKEQYFKIDGQPLLLNFGPIYLKDPAVWQASLATIEPRPLFFALHHLWQKAGADGGFSWVHYSAWKDDPTTEEIYTRLNKTFRYYGSDPHQMIVSATPGFKDVYTNPHPVLDHREGKTLAESLEVCMRGPWKVVQLVTWNDYGEGTIIEPTHQFGYLFLEKIQEARRKELGDAFPFTAEDLHLPMRLFQLRKGGAVPSAELDRIAEWLASGKVKEAREALDRLEG